MNLLFNIALILIISIATLQAKEGFSGEIGLGGGYAIGKDNMAVDNDNSRVSQKGKDNEVKGAIPAPVLTLNYNNIAFGMSDDGNIMLGFDNGEYRVLGLYAFEAEYWKNPYIFNGEREKIDGKAYGLNVGYNFLEIIDVGYTLMVEDVDDTTTPTALKQSGNTHSLDAEVFAPLIGESVMFRVAASYTFADMDGDANSYKGYSLGGGPAFMMDPFMVMLAISKETNDYDASNPVFNKTREDDITSYMVHVEVENGLGFDNTKLTFMGMVEEGDSNIDFYDKENKMLMIMGSYVF